MKLHIGCGNKILKGWINCDVQDLPGVDLVSSLEDMTFESNSVDEIYLCHALEHFGRHEVGEICDKLYRWIKPNGKLWIAVPDFEACVAHYKEHHDLSQLLGLLMGGQKDRFDFHKMLFDQKSLTTLLNSAGFTSVRRYDRNEHDVEKQMVDDFSAAYLPHMDKEGRLMSLNLLAIKQ